MGRERREKERLQRAHRYRIRYTTRNWIGRDDPRGYGRHSHYVNSDEEVKKFMEYLSRNGHRLDLLIDQHE